MWLARSKNDNLLLLFQSKPIYIEEEDSWVQPLVEGMFSDTMIVKENMPEITFENSPVEVSLVKVIDIRVPEINTSLRGANLLKYE